MEPYIRSGELVEVEPISLDQLSPFDIIVYWEEKRSVLICHIFKEVRENKIICMPLAINREDKPFHPTLLLARATKLKFGFFQKLLLKWFR